MKKVVMKLVEKLLELVLSKYNQKKESIESMDKRMTVWRKHNLKHYEFVKKDCEQKDFFNITQIDTPPAFNSDWEKLYNVVNSKYNWKDLSKIQKRISIVKGEVSFILSKWDKFMYNIGKTLFFTIIACIVLLLFAIPLFESYRFYMTAILIILYMISTLIFLSIEKMYLTIYIEKYYNDNKLNHFSN